MDFKVLAIFVMALFTIVFAGADMPNYKIGPGKLRLFFTIFKMNSLSCLISILTFQIFWLFYILLNESQLL